MPLRPCSCDACFDADLANSMHGMALNQLLMVPKHCLHNVGAETLLGPSELERGMQSMRAVCGIVVCRRVHVFVCLDAFQHF